MRRTIVILAFLVAVLLINASAVDNDTRPSEPRDGGRVVGEINVRDEGSGPAVVLVHGFGASLSWWNRIAPGLARTHRVIRLDLIGHGGSAAPDSGYAMEQQARAVARTLRALGVRRLAAAVGHSMGGNVVTSLAEQYPRLVRRVVIIDSAPSTDERFASDLGPLADLYTTPIVGQVISRFRPDSAVRDGVQRAFASSFQERIPDRFVEDVKRLPWPAFKRSREKADEYRDERSLDRRLRRLRKPLLAIWGPQDRIAPVAGLEEFGNVRGAELVEVDGAGHTPMVERPRATLRALRAFLR